MGPRSFRTSDTRDGHHFRLERRNPPRLRPSLLEHPPWQASLHRASMLDGNHLIHSYSKRSELLEKPPGLRERNRLRTREDLLVAISLLLGERAYDTISIDDVAQRAGVSRGTVYAYFPEGRDELVREAYVRIADKVTRDGEARHLNGGGVVDRIVGYATAMIEAVSTPEGRFYGVMGPDIVSTIASVRGTSSMTFLRVMTEDLRDALGDQPGDAPIEEIAVAFSGAVREIGAAAALEPDRVPRLLSALRIMCSSLLDGIQR